MLIWLWRQNLGVWGVPGGQFLTFDPPGTLNPGFGTLKPARSLNSGFKVTLQPSAEGCAWIFEKNAQKHGFWPFFSQKSAPIRGQNLYLMHANSVDPSGKTRKSERIPLVYKAALGLPRPSREASRDPKTPGQWTPRTQSNWWVLALTFWLWGEGF
jgi:hypothetical protein